MFLFPQQTLCTFTFRTFFFFFLLQQELLTHLVASHAVAVENANLLIFLAGHVVQALVGLHVTDLRQTHTDQSEDHLLKQCGQWRSLCVCACGRVRQWAYLSQRVVVPGDLGVRVDVLQIPAEGFTLELLSQSGASWDVTVVHLGHTWRGKHRHSCINVENCLKAVMTAEMLLCMKSFACKQNTWCVLNKSCHPGTSDY